MLIDINDSGCCAVASIESFTEEPLRCLGISLGAEQEVQSVALLINGSVQPPPLTSDVHINFIDSLLSH